MSGQAFNDWKKDAGIPFPAACLAGNPGEAGATWGASSLPWLILTDKAHRVVAEGFTLDDLQAKLQDLKE